MNWTGVRNLYYELMFCWLESRSWSTDLTWFFSPRLLRLFLLFLALQRSPFLLFSFPLNCRSFLSKYNIPQSDILTQSASYIALYILIDGQRFVYHYSGLSPTHHTPFISMFSIASIHFLAYSPHYSPVTQTERRSINVLNETCNFTHRMLFQIHIRAPPELTSNREFPHTCQHKSWPLLTQCRSQLTPHEGCCLVFFHTTTQ